ncbi:PD40 domain-containing protein [Falsibacillus pallidus]|uniref:WD40 repeat protein n=1 Tax=Falsibacillus pallidus TaxID=493781 RepID=A0A370GUY5_9BACI|nr:PD40 domain-containing protein [Falsibacillus pallidus]RDI45743.1 WD40 repeat protein [Falsibacillus pallidus]
MALNKEEMLSDYIDWLNDERQDIHPMGITADKDLEKMFETAEMIHSMELEQSEPSQAFMDRVSKRIREEEAAQKSKKKSFSWKTAGKWLPLGAAAVVALSLLWNAFGATPPAGASDISVVEIKTIADLRESAALAPSYRPGMGREEVIYSKDDQIWRLQTENGEKTVFPLNNFQYMHDPAWSPDGKRLAFAGYKNGKEGIWIMNADGTVLQQVTDPPSNEEFHEHPNWSPDGETLLFSKLGEKIVEPHGAKVVGNEVWKVNADGSGLKKITQGGSPVWSPLGDKIAFTRTSAEGETFIWLADSDGSNAEKLTEGSEPSWSPDGRFIAFVQKREENLKLKDAPSAIIQATYRDVMALDTTNGQITTLTKNEFSKRQLKEVKKQVENQTPSTSPIKYMVSGKFDDGMPTWAKDGKHILLTRNENTEEGSHFRLIELTLTIK